MGTFRKKQHIYNRNQPPGPLSPAFKCRIKKTTPEGQLAKKRQKRRRFSCSLYVEPTRNNPMYNRYRHALPGLNSLHRQALVAKLQFFSKLIPFIYVHIYTLEMHCNALEISFRQFSLQERRRPVQ